MGKLIHFRFTHNRIKSSIIYFFDQFVCGGGGGWNKIDRKHH